jgi:hypothetical protein
VLRKYGFGESATVAHQIRSQPSAKHPLPISPQLLKLFQLNLPNIRRQETIQSESSTENQTPALNVKEIL